MFLVFWNLSHSPTFTQWSLAVAQRCSLLTPSTPLDMIKYVLEMWTHPGYLHALSLSSTALLINPFSLWRSLFSLLGIWKQKSSVYVTYECQPYALTQSSVSVSILLAPDTIKKQNKLKHCFQNTKHIPHTVHTEPHTCTHNLASKEISATMKCWSIL